MRLRQTILTLILAPAFAAATLRAQLITLPPGPDPTTEGMADDGAVASTPQTLSGRVAAMLVNRDYDLINRLADRARTEKSRAKGGTWRLREIYTGISGPGASATGYDDTITRLQAWILAEPDNITPRVALAQAYTRYAWVARGSGYSDSVSPANYRLFFDRITRAHQTLDAALSLKRQCPQWFSEMQTVALAEGWDAERAEELFNRATRFEPEYIYFYQAYANYLLPKWEGKPGQSAAFAQASADKVAATLGNDKGDFIYFRIGTVLLGSSNGNYRPSQLDWERLQRGHTAIAKLYGDSNASNNEFALMAWRYRDLSAATPIFSQIGTRWSRNVWKTRERFDKAREWAMADAPAAPSPAP